MLPALRRARIIELLRQNGGMGLKDIAKELKASVSTLRRDVDYLCELGHLDRTHGGAMLKSGLRAGAELERDIASELNSGAKRAIGLHAAELIRPGQTVIIDSGTTTAAAARIARDRRISFTAITNDLAIGALLANSSYIQVQMTGGLVRPGTSTLLGADALQSISRLRADLALVGAHALSQDEASDTSIELAELKRVIIAAADHSVLLVDSSKVFSHAFCSFGKVKEFDQLITDSKIAPDQVAALTQRGAQVRVIPVAS